ncbi:hypothetical protein [Nostoc favosum]|uniref:Uncharacterized protein n=1 Tax=Nostoc favosum CHAB5714 TaxID=2780399 RepID=A0ABS8IPJ2_9NOSO|nr:hypothetical protein [Nostoc favosum]MCC5605158.1 hypothetical protein [Nostoc favosum CHAB5714]
MATDRSKEVERKKAEALVRLNKATAEGRQCLNERDPNEIARDFEAVHPHLFLVGAHWAEFSNGIKAIERDTVRARLQRWMDTAVNIETGNKVYIDRLVLNRVMNALANLRKRPTGFQPPSASVVKFVREWCLLRQFACIQTVDLFKAFCAFCKYNGEAACSQKAFARQLLEALRDARVMKRRLSIDGRPRVVYEGICLSAAASLAADINIYY